MGDPITGEGEPVTFAEMDHTDWLRQWDRVESGELGHELREIVRKMGEGNA